MRIGIDIGNVIIGGGGEDTSFFSDNYLDTPTVPNAFVSILALHETKKHELHIISKCGLRTEDKSLNWLFTNGFFYLFKQHRMHFVRKRGLKAMMAMALELDIFIDDREDVLAWMKGVVTYPILFTSWEQTNAELKAIFEAEGVAK